MASTDTDTSKDDILLVEDNPMDVEITKLAFKQNHFPYSVRVVSDGEEALEYLFCTDRYENRADLPPPKLILLDLKLPFISGLEVLRALKENARTRRIPVIVLSASREVRDIAQSYELGASSYIVKPINFDQFREISNVVIPYWMQLVQLPPR